jgi:hypothetical protein
MLSRTLTRAVPALLLPRRAMGSEPAAESLLKTSV